MEYKIIVDSCTDFNDKYLDDSATRIPFKITIGELEMDDDKTLDVAHMTDLIRENNYKVLSACSSPEAFTNVLDDDKFNFIIALSSAISGSYNSAKLAMAMANEKGLDNVYVFDSKSASSGQTIILLKLQELINTDLPKDTIIEQLEDFIANNRTVYLPESCDILAKSGRISNYTAAIGGFLGIIPILWNSKKGEIVLKCFARGKKNAVKKFIESLGESTFDLSTKILGISHVNAMEKVLEIEKEIKKLYNFKNIIIFEPSGVSAVYIADGGIIMSF